MQREDLTGVLDYLQNFDDVLACTIAKRGLEGISPTTVKLKDVNVWRLVREATNGLFDIIGGFYGYGLERMTLELGDYTLVITPINREVSLIVLTNSLANMGLLDIEIENARIKIKEIADK